jgi:hypothetical protein
MHSVGGDTDQTIAAIQSGDFQKIIANKNASLGARKAGCCDTRSETGRVDVERLQAGAQSPGKALIVSSRASLRWAQSFLNALICA